MRVMSKSKIRLDVACGTNKQSGFVGMDYRKLNGVDIVHDAERLPWPVPAGSCSVVLMSHIWEHLKPWLSIKIANEVWRVLEPGGQWWLVTPYANSFGYLQDPTHCNPANEVTWEYFDPRFNLFEVYEPKPFKIMKRDYQLVGNLEVVMEKVKLNGKRNGTKR